jgi:hypothetical protein
MVTAGATPETHPDAWRSLERAEGSDWFWWFGDDHATDDRAVFDALFREHVRAAYTGAGLDPPGALQAPIAGGAARRGGHLRPIAFVTPVIDGRSTQFYEWHDAGRVDLAAGGGAMHRGGGLVTSLHYGFDATRFYLRLDFAPGALDVKTEAGKTATPLALRVELSAPRSVRLDVGPLVAGSPVVRRAGENEPLPGAECRLDRLFELAVPFAAVALVPGEQVELTAQLVGENGPLETLPPDDLLHFTVPGAGDDLKAWSL